MPDLVSLASRATLSLPPIRGLGILIEHASRVFSGIDREVVTVLDGSKITANPSNTDGRRHLFASRYHDRAERAFVASILRPGDYAIDLGANIGLYSLLFARLVGPSGRVTAIEAEPANAARLRQNLALNSYVHVNVVEQGASDKHEMLTLHLSGTNLGMHSFVVDEGLGDVEVLCAPLSTMIDGRARLMKIDIELFEYPVLKRFFADAAPKPEYILMEVWYAVPEGRDALETCLQNDYEQIASLGTNVVLKLARASR